MQNTQVETPNHHNKPMLTGSQAVPEWRWPRPV